jgi:hypothetical protein
VDLAFLIIICQLVILHSAPSCCALNGGNRESEKVMVMYTPKYASDLSLWPRKDVVGCQLTFCRISTVVWMIRSTPKDHTVL